MAAARAFPPQPINFEDESGIIRDLPLSPPSHIHKLMIDVDDLSAKDFLRLNTLYCHRTSIDEWILGVHNPQSGVGFALTRLFSLMRLFRPCSLMIQQSARILESEAFRSFLRSSPQLALLVIDCSQEFQLSELFLEPLQELRVNILQDQHIESISNLSEGVTKLHLWISHGITPGALQGLVIPTSVQTLSLSTQQVSFEQFRMLSSAIKRHESIYRLEIGWRGTNPSDLLGMESSPTIRNLDLHVSKASTLSDTHLAIDAVTALEAEYLRLFDIVRETPFTALRVLALRVGNGLEKEYCESLIKLVQSIQTLRGFHLAQFPLVTFDMDKAYKARFNFYCDLHSLPKDVMSREIPLKLWPNVLEKTKAVPSILFHLLQGKNDLLIPRSNSKVCGKRKRTPPG